QTTTASLIEARRCIDNDIASCLAYDLWHARQYPTNKTPEHSVLVKQLLHDALAQSNEQALLAIHGRTRLRKTNNDGDLQFVSLVGQTGAALLSPFIQLAQPSGWWETGSAQHIKAPPRTQAALNRVNGLNTLALDRPVLHVLEQASQRLLRT